MEAVLNQVFALDGMLVREAFSVSPEGVTGEQIDGVVVLDGHDYLVEVKWWSVPVEINAVSRHLVRLFSRADTRGLIVSCSSYTSPAVDECARALNQKVIVLSDLYEILVLLEQAASVSDWLRAKVRYATLDRVPYKVVLPADL